MLQLLNPIWLFGIGGILVPLIIHLWNVKTGKTLKVGSITLMGESSRQNSRSLKLSDLLLLFLRCLMIILLSIMLAEPVWRNLKTAKENKAWVLVEKNAFSETYRHFKKEIDSLNTPGNELHLFEPGFKKADLDDLIKDTTATDTSAILPYWSLFRLMEQQIPPGSKAFIFTGDRLSRFKGARPTTTTAFTWKTYSPSDSASRWINQAYISSSGDIRAIVSESRPKGIVRKTVDINPGGSNTGIQSTINDGKAQLQLNDQKVIADTSTLTIAINAEGFPSDAEYLSAAINAIQKYTGRKIKLVKPSSQQDILFWLSSKALPSGLKPGSTVFQYGQGKVTSTTTWIAPKGHNPLQTEKISLHKRIGYPERAVASPIWEDGFGKPLLDLTRTNDISRYTFYSRLNPEWTDLVWSPEFVKLLIPLILPQRRSINEGALDKRSFGGQVYHPILGGRAESGKLKVEASDNLELYIWFLLIAVFLTERYMSFRNATI